jgi:hypothetical protein
VESEEVRLTPEELEVANLIGAAYCAFAELEVYNPYDHDEFVHHVHAMGRIVLSRSAIRAHPERGWLKGPAATDA